MRCDALSEPCHMYPLPTHFLSTSENCISLTLLGEIEVDREGEAVALHHISKFVPLLLHSTSLLPSPLKVDRESLSGLLSNRDSASVVGDTHARMAGEWEEEAAWEVVACSKERCVRLNWRLREKEVAKWLLANGSLHTQSETNLPPSPNKHVQY